MPPIDSVQHIVATIRSQMAARIGNADPRRAAPRSPAPAHEAALQQRMANLIGQRVKALAPDDQQRGKKAFRIFLESVLLTELGEQLINDPGFYELVDAVQSTMEQDQQIADAIAKAVDSLLASPGAR